MRKIDPLIYIRKKTLDPDFCTHCIEKFKLDDRKYTGLCGEGVVKNDIKQSTDLVISGLSGWEDEDKYFKESLSEHLEAYKSWVPEIYKTHVTNDGAHDTGYQLQETKPGGFYVWHHDQMGLRRVTFIWYLNDIKEDGYTEFTNGLKVQPKAGTILLFPALWPWIHRGFPPKSETKYISTGWISDGSPSK